MAVRLACAFQPRGDICDAPEPDTVAAGKDARAGLIERDRLNGHIVTRKKIPQHFSGARIPQPRGAILGAGRDALAIGRKCRRHQPGSVRGKLALVGDLIVIHSEGKVAAAEESVIADDGLWNQHDCPAIDQLAAR